jgi:hypothetical protein
MNQQQEAMKTTRVTAAAAPSPPSHLSHEQFRKLVGNFAVVQALACCLDVSDVEGAAKALLTASGAAHELGVLRQLIRHEFELHAARPNETLRDQTLASRALGQHARRLGGRFLRITLGVEVLPALLALPHALEVDPNRLAAGGSVEANASELAGWLDRIVLEVTSARALDALPTPMRHVIAEIGRCSSESGGDKSGGSGAVQDGEGCGRAVTAMLGGYFILRFINPAIVNPLGHGLAAVPPSDAARRSLVLLAKLLQAAANGSDPKESFMAPLLPAVHRAAVPVGDFLRRIAREDPPPEPSEPVPTIASGTADPDVTGALQVLARLCVRLEAKLRTQLPAEIATDLCAAATAIVAEVDAEARRRQPPRRATTAAELVVHGGVVVRDDQGGLVDRRGRRARSSSLTERVSVAAAKARLAASRTLSAVLADARDGSATQEGGVRPRRGSVRRLRAPSFEQISGPVCARQRSNSRSTHPPPAPRPTSQPWAPPALSSQPAIARVRARADARERRAVEKATAHSCAGL